MSEAFTALSNGMAGVVEAVGPSIVRVEARSRMPASGIVYSAEGLIVTAHHVVEQEEGIQIGLADGKTLSAKLVGRDPGSDLAVLRTESGGLQAASWVDASQLKVGHLVLALGRPGLSVQATLGVVSALGGAWRTHAGGEIDRYLQTDVVMYPGFSGGPLVTASGQVAGLNSSALVRGTSVAIPAATIKRVVEALVAHGKMPRAYLGVGVQPVRLPEALQKELNQETALMLMSVEAGGAASKAGLTQGDILVTFDGQPMRSPDELHRLLSADRVNKPLPARIVRGGSLQTVEVTVGQG